MFYISSEHLNNKKLPEAIPHAKQLGFDGIEIFGNEVVSGSLTEKTNQDRLRKTATEHKCALSFHPWLEWSSLPADEVIYKTKDLCGNILSCGSNQLNIHPDFIADNIPRIILVFNELDDFITSNGIKIYFENVYSGFGSEVSCFESIFSGLKADNYAFNLDTGHAFISGGIKNYITAMGSRWQYTHIHDNDGTADQHKAPLDGKIDWQEFKALAENYNGIYMFEFSENDLKDCFFCK